MFQNYKKKMFQNKKKNFFIKIKNYSLIYSTNFGNACKANLSHVFLILIGVLKK